MNQIERQDWATLAGLVGVWGSSFAMTKIAVAQIDASWVMALRLAVSAAVLVPYALARGTSFKVAPAIWAKFTVLAIVGNVAPFLLISWGTRLVASGVSGLLMGAIPLFLVVIAHFVLPEERLTRIRAAGFVIGFLGVIVLLGPREILRVGLAGDALKGELAILLSCVLYAVHAVGAKRLGMEEPVLQSAAVCLVSGVLGVAVASLLAPPPGAATPLGAWAAVIGLGLLPTALATLLVYRLVARVGPSFVAYANYLVPVWAVGLGAVLLHEPVGWTVIAALALILGGIAISRMKV